MQYFGEGDLASVMSIEERRPIDHRGFNSCLLCMFCLAFFEPDFVGLEPILHPASSETFGEILSGWLLQDVLSYEPGFTDFTYSYRQQFTGFRTGDVYGIFIRTYTFYRLYILTERSVYSYRHFLQTIHAQTLFTDLVFVQTLFPSVYSYRHFLQTVLVQTILTDYIRTNIIHKLVPVQWYRRVTWY